MHTPLLSLAFRTAPAGMFRQPRPAQVRILSPGGASRRVRPAGAARGSVDRYVCARWVDEACIGAIVVSALYFVPVLIPLLIG
ncbi:MAG: hypothetical protein ACYC7J_06020 [Syntrophales bacterium]